MTSSNGVHAPAPAPDDKPRALAILYRNHRGEVAVRRIVPALIRYGTEAPWHPEPGWLIGAYDIDKGADRTFALAGILEWFGTPDMRSKGPLRGRPLLLMRRPRRGLLVPTGGRCPVSDPTPPPDAPPQGDDRPRCMTPSGPVDPSAPDPERERRDRIASRGVEAAFKFAEDSRRDADEQAIRRDEREKVARAIEAERDCLRALADCYAARGLQGAALLESLRATEAGACLEIVRGGAEEEGQK